MRPRPHPCPRRHRQALRLGGRAATRRRSRFPLARIALLAAVGVLAGFAPLATAAPEPAEPAPSPSTPGPWEQGLPGELRTPPVSPSPPTPQPPASPGPAPDPGASPGPLPTPEPEPAPEGGSGGVGPGLGGPGSDDPAWWDIPGQVAQAINSWFRSLVTGALNPVLDLVGRTLLSSPDVAAQGRVRELWEHTRVLANTVLVLFVLAAGVLVMAHETLQTSYAVKQVGPRLVVGAVAANVSLPVAGQAVVFANAVSRALAGAGLDPERAAQTLKQIVVSAVGVGGVWVVLIGLVAVVLALVLLVVYVIRAALLILLVVAAPLALVCHALPQTEGLARLWWRATTGVLAIQLAQALVLVTALRVFFGGNGPTWLGLPSGGGLVDLVITICLLYILVRIPVWVSRQIWSGQRSTLVRLAKYAVIHRTLTLPRAAGTGR